MWTKEEIGKVIKESRLSAGLTQTQVAEALGRPQNTISAWEIGRAQPDANTLFELFQVLGRSVDEAFGFTKQPFEVTRFEQEHIEKYRSLDPYGKEAVDGVLDVESRRCEAEQQVKSGALRESREQMEAVASIPITQKKPTPFLEGGLEDTEECLMKYVTHLNPDQQQALLDYAKKMIAPQKELAVVSVPPEVDDKPQEFEPPTQS